MEVGIQFDTFQQFKDALDNLRLTGYHPLRICNSQSGEDYNKKRQGKKICTDVVDTAKINYTYYSVVCVHYGDTRQRGKGIRPNQSTFTMNCKVKITVSYDRLALYLSTLASYVTNITGFIKSCVLETVTLSIAIVWDQRYLYITQSTED